MAKFVRYNGGTESYYGCSSAKLLNESHIYEIIHEEVLACQTNYTLKGVEGYFNSVWFDEVPVYLAIAKTKPEAMKQFNCIRFVHKKENTISEKVTTSPVNSVEPLSANIYRIFTKNSCYIVQIC